MDDDFVDFSSNDCSSEHLATSSDTIDKNSEKFSQKEESNEDESLDFSRIPLHLQCNVINKLDFKEFVRLEQSSSLANNACWMENHFFSVQFPIIYVNKKTIKLCPNEYYEYGPSIPRIPYHNVCQSSVKIGAEAIIIPERISSSRLQRVTKLFKMNKTTSDELMLVAHITFKPEDLDGLLKVTSPKLFTCSQFLSREFLQMERLQRIDYLSLNSTGCTDDELVKQNGKECLSLTSDFITARGLNNFLKQWKRKEREIDFVRIDFGSTNGSPNVEEIIAGIGANPIWTPETHTYSIVAGLPIEVISDGHPEHHYSLWRPDNHEERITVIIGDEMFCIQRINDEASYVLDWLTDDQYYSLQNRCMYCDTQFCEHRRIYSTARLKNYFPRMYRFLTTGFRGLKVISVTALLMTFIAGERPFTRVPQFGFEMLQQKTGVSRVISTLQLYLFDHV